ncbi:MAG: hypothetical protein HY748_18190 [Elusimicrobia bacterium]|nr:hypothetical protein [Elusimicrobiota bacterium]
MASPEKCPGCGSPVKPDWTVCGHCLLPRHILSISPASQDKPAGPKPSSPFAVAGALRFGLAVLVLGAFIYSRQKTALQLAPPRPPAVAAPAANSPDAAGDASTTAGDVSVQRSPAKEWTIKGQVYDLSTLKPVADAQLALTDKLSGLRFTAKTDPAGVYSVKVPSMSEGGYEVAVLIKRRPRPFLEEMDPPYKTQNPERRRDALELLDSPSLAHVAIMLTGSDSELLYDLVVAQQTRR